MSVHEALRADIETAVFQALRPPLASSWERERARLIADRCVHLVVLHGLLPETERALTPPESRVVGLMAAIEQSVAAAKEARGGTEEQLFDCPTCAAEGIVDGVIDGNGPARTDRCPRCLGRRTVTAAEITQLHQGATQ